ncbi:MAG: serine hydrolase [Pseudomonadota bacterium]
MRNNKGLLGLAVTMLFVMVSSVGIASDAETQGLQQHLDEIVTGEKTEQPLVGVAVSIKVGDTLIQAASGCAELSPPAGDEQTCLRPMLPTTKVRVASISKFFVALGIQKLVASGKIDLDTNVNAYLPFEVTGQHAPKPHVTARTLLSHTSSLRDPEEYWVQAPGAFEDLFSQNDLFQYGDTDSETFNYANLGYGILAGVIEAVSTERFDRFMTEQVFTPNGYDVGFNWSGVSVEGRRSGGVLYRWVDGAWRPQTDAPETLSDDRPVIYTTPDLDTSEFLSDYEPTSNPSLFSPQGGLRASAADLATMITDPDLRPSQEFEQPAWSRSTGGVAAEGNEWVDAYGLGVQIVEAPLGNDDIVLKGHSGEAYGLYSGAWSVKTDSSKQEPISIAYVITGVKGEPIAGSTPAFNQPTEAVLRAALEVVRAAQTSSKAP